MSGHRSHDEAGEPSIKVGAAQIKAATGATQFAAMLLQFGRAIGAEARGYGGIRLAVDGFVIESLGNNWTRFTHSGRVSFDSTKQP